MPLTALSDALDTVPNSNNTILNFVENPAKGHMMAFNVTKNSKGDIVIHARQRQYVQMVMMTDANGHSEDVELGESSHNDYDLTITIPRANLDKLGSSDWSKYDHKPVQRAAVGGDVIAHHHELQGEIAQFDVVVVVRSKDLTLNDWHKPKADAVPKKPPQQPDQPAERRAMIPRP